MDIRLFTEQDSVEELTELLHRAYAQHAAEGRRFFASHQTPRDTRHRISKGECWVAIDDGVMLGTVTLMGPHAKPPGYPASLGAGSFSQLAVLPQHQRGGLGNRLLELAERRIATLGAQEIVIDTSSLASELIGWYERRGYAAVGTWKWEITNYESIVLRKPAIIGTRQSP